MKQAHVAQCLGWETNMVQIKQQWGNTNGLVNDSLVVSAFNPLMSSVYLTAYSLMTFIETFNSNTAQASS